MTKLAINGGSPVLPNGFDTDWPIFDEDEESVLKKVLESGNWCSGEWYFKDSDSSEIANFEKEFAEYVGTNYATAVPTGTDALELAFRAIDLKPGDEVIVPAITFIASASAVVMANGVPRFVDVDPETFQISPEAIERAINNRTKAIEPVHYGGYPADMDKIMEIADQHNLYVIEDAAEAHGSEWKGERVGSLGDMGCFSFQLGKPLTCGEGGGVTFNDDDLAMSCYSQARLGRKPDGEKYKHHVPAGNFRMSEFLGGILRKQLNRLPEQTNVRQKNGNYLAEEIEKIQGLSTLKEDSRITKRGYYFYFLKYDSKKWEGLDRDRFMETLQAEGVDCSTAHNDPLYENPAFKDIDPALLHGNVVDYSDTHCPNAEKIYKEEAIALDKDFLMKRKNADKIIEAIEKIRGNLKNLL